MNFRYTLAALALYAAPAFAAQTDVARLEAELTRVAQRLAQLEAAPPPATPADVEHAAQREALRARLEDLEIELLSLRRQTREIETVEGISAAAGLTLVSQAAVAGETDAAEAQFNYRADASVTLSAGAIGAAAGRLFTHFRLGQGEGVPLSRPGFSSTPNSTGFELSAGEDAAAVLAQAWYQLDVPIDGAAAVPPRHLELNFGKLDPFVFFDQNAIADDETTRFLNNAFVHNPLLDSGSAAGVDAYGFTPGGRFAYHADGAAGEWWRASIAAFGAGSGAAFRDSFSRPFVIAQLEVARRYGDRAANYRLYAWTNGRATPYANPADTGSERQSGWGLSIDQQVAPTFTLFARYGRATEGCARFDRAVTAGAEAAGTAWGRENDRLGIGAGWLRASHVFEAAAPTLDADGIDGADFAYAPRGAERLAELYYAWQVNPHLALAPDLQWIGRPGADPSADDIVVAGVRATMTF